MLKQYFLDIMRKECNGLYLCEVPTGIGKSYQAAHAMEEYVFLQRGVLQPRKEAAVNFGCPPVYHIEGRDDLYDAYDIK